GVDLGAAEQLVLDPVDQAAPVGRVVKDDGEAVDLVRLDQRERLEQLVEGAEAAGEQDEALGVLDEHGFATEEVAEVDRQVNVGVDGLLVGQLDVAADREA